MYYTNVPYKAEYASLLAGKTIHTFTDDQHFLKRLDDHGYLYMKDSNTLIIQDHTHIAKLFVEGIFQPKHLISMVQSAHIFVVGKKSEASKHLRIVVDPHKGIHDSINRRLKAVGDPDQRFTEDALRIIRAIRFVNVLNTKLKNC
jgi:hypothetical protein